MRLPRTAPLLSTRLFALLVPFHPATGLRVGAHALRAAPPLSRLRCSAAAEPDVHDDADTFPLVAEPERRHLLSEATKKTVGYRQKWTCAACDCLLPPSYEVDHIVPLALGGGHGLTNLQALCKPCHAQKTRDQRRELLEARAPATAERKEEKRRKRRGARRPPPFPGAAPAADPAADAGVALALSPLDLLRGMNQQQLYAVLRTNGTVRLAAGPGSGKTRVLTARIAHLIHTERVPPSRVLALTFTNKAARELRERITALLGPAASDQVTMGTFHSLCLSMLRNDIERLGPELPYRRGFAVYDADEALKLVRQLLAAEGRAPPKKGAAVPTLEREGAEASQVQSAISYAKNRMLDAASFAAQYGAGSIVARVFARYEAELRARNVVDFDDMLTLSVALLRDVPEARAKYQRMWSHMHVDEFQDTNSPQYRVLALLGGGHSNVFAVGDADQAIYGWRGADAANQARLDDEFCVLEGPSVPAAPLPPSAFDSGDALRAAVPALLPGLDCARPPADDADDAAAAIAAGVRLRLELNYRSTQPVLDAAMALLRPAYAAAAAAGFASDGQQQLQLVAAEKAAATVEAAAAAASARATGAVEVVEVADQEEEAVWVVEKLLAERARARAAAAEGAPVPKPSSAILFRTNSQALPFERELLRQGVPYELLQARSFFQRKEIRDALSYLRLLVHDDALALERVINVPPRKIGATTWKALEAAAAERGDGVWAALERAAALNATGGGKAAAEAAGVAGVPKSAVRPLAGFHALIARYRAAVAPPNATAGDADAGDAGADGDGDDTGADGAPLRLAGSVLHYAARLGPEEGGGGRAAEAGGAVGSLASLFRLLMRESGYEALVRSEGGGGSKVRWRNLGELATMAAPYAAHELQAFLDQVALVSDMDASDDHGTRREAEDAVKLMTIHASKGLEFDSVYVAGVEEGLLPHYYSIESGGRDEIEEERRLLYVAMTRARQHVVLTHAAYRMRWGKPSTPEPSRFLAALPESVAARTKTEGAGSGGGGRRWTGRYAP